MITILLLSYLHERSLSDFEGVSYDQGKGLYKVGITVSGRSINLVWFEDDMNAAVVYQCAVDNAYTFKGNYQEFKQMLIAETKDCLI